MSREGSIHRGLRAAVERLTCFRICGHHGMAISTLRDDVQNSRDAMAESAGQFSLRRLLAATGLAAVAACMLSDVPGLRCPPAQVLIYFLSAAVAGAGLGALLKRPLYGSMIGLILAGPAIPPLAIVRRLVIVRFGM